MTLVLDKDVEERALVVRASGKLTKDDYRALGPELDDLVERHGKIRLLVDLVDFHGWRTDALWEDLKLDVRHFRNIERLAIVGETRWQRWMSVLARPFTTAEVRYFTQDQGEEAYRWIKEP